MRFKASCAEYAKALKEEDKINTALLERTLPRKRLHGENLRQQLAFLQLKLQKGEARFLKLLVSQLPVTLPTCRPFLTLPAGRIRAIADLQLASDALHMGHNLLCNLRWWRQAAT